ncbi:hypothetical protein B0H14DRAFT_2560291 [Mycena olivaceomarginata]|nr:hypothetical protein B0H14DRAFT_2560291 [Mycena olivaceomarginata]
MEWDVTGRVAHHKKHISGVGTGRDAGVESRLQQGTGRAWRRGHGRGHKGGRCGHSCWGGSGCGVADKKADVAQPLDLRAKVGAVVEWKEQVIGMHIHIRIYIKQQLVPIQHHTGDTPEAFKNSYSTVVMCSLNMTFWRNATRTMCWRDEKPVTGCILMMRTEGRMEGRQQKHERSKKNIATLHHQCNGHLLLLTAVSYVDTLLSPLTPFRGVEWQTPFCLDNGRMTFSAMEWMGIQGLNIYLAGSDIHEKQHGESFRNRAKPGSQKIPRKAGMFAQSRVPENSAQSPESENSAQSQEMMIERKVEFIPGSFCDQERFEFPFQ